MISLFKNVKHPKSTRNNLFYVLAGIGVIILGVLSSLWLKIVAGGAVVALGIASTGYHWTEKRAWQRADIISIFAVFFIAIAWQLSTFEGFERYDWWLFLIFAGLSIAMGFTYKDWTHTQIGVLSIINLAILWPRAGFIQFIGAFLLFIFGLYFGQLAEQYRHDSDAYDRYHAKWKPPTAAAIFLMLL